MDVSQPAPATCIAKAALHFATNRMSAGVRHAGTASSFGYDAQTGEFKDLIAAGIIDPTKVVRVALQNAASVAGLLITTEAMVAERPEKRVQSLPQGGMDGMDY